MRIKLKLKNETIYSMSEFKLLPPKSRSYLTELIGQTLSKTEGLININYFLNLFLNGDNLGTYALEEHLTKELLREIIKEMVLFFLITKIQEKLKFLMKISI